MNASGRPVAYVLIENGMHQGARLELSEYGVWYSAGGVVDADYWLADPELADAKIEFASAEGQVWLRLHAGPEAVLDGAIVGVGGQGRIDRSVVWGGVGMRAVVMPAEEPAAAAAEPPPEETPKSAQQVRWDAAVAAARGAGSRLLQRAPSPRRLGLGLLALLAVALPLIAVGILLDSMQERYHQSERQSQALAVQSDPRQKLADARAAAQRLADLIGLRTVSVVAVDGKSLALFGSDVPADRSPAIRAAITQFEPEFVVRDNIAYNPERPDGPLELVRLPEGIDFVQYGPDGFLRGPQGRAYLAGGTLPDGMRIEEIRDDQIWFTRGTQQAVLRARALLQ